MSENQIKQKKILSPTLLLPTLLQGTDGIRGRISEESPKNPIQYFIQQGILTPSFFEKYAFAYGSLLLQKKIIAPLESIVLGRDPRDPQKVFWKAFVQGIQKVGLSVIDIGILPTPAIPLYMLSIQAKGAVMLTASHNPSNQHGIKLFHGYTGLKFLPGDDQELSQILYSQEKQDLSNAPLIGKWIDESEKGKQYFIDFLLDSENSWIEDSIFKNVILYIDCAKGATSTIIKEIFSNFSFCEVYYTQLSLQGNINEFCGVADIEGVKEIPIEEILEPTCFYNQYKTLVSFATQANKDTRIQKGSHKLIGIIFDGDGDRCFILYYNPLKHIIEIFNGDMLAFFQAQRLKNKKIATQNSWFVHTVESDFLTGVTAKKQGWNPKVTAVGDKWIQLQAIVDWMQKSFIWNTSKNNIIEQELKQEKPSGFTISKLCVDESQKEILIKNLNFQIGFEESGHCITPALMQMKNQKQIVFLGNGIKTALNSLAAFEENNFNFTQKFSEGFKKIYYIYFVQKQLLSLEHPFRKQLIQFISQEVLGSWSSEISFTQVVIQGEIQMLYWKLKKNGTEDAVLFIRNSGTEDKTGIYLFGNIHSKELLESIGEQIQNYLLQHLKNENSPFVLFQKKILNAIQNRNEIQSILKEHQNLPVDQILKDMEGKEKLFFRKSQTLYLTNIGKKWITLQ